MKTTPVARPLFSLILGLTLGVSLATVPAQWSNAQQPTPINAGSTVMIDLPDSSAESVRLEIKNGRFADQSVGRLALDAQGIDFKNGSLKGLNMTMDHGIFDNVPVDQLNLQTGAFTFDTFELLNKRRFVLAQPVQANVTLKITEDSLNKFISNPKTLEKLTKAISKKTGNLNLISFSNPSLDLMGKNKVKLSMTSSLGNAIATPISMTGNLGVKNGQLVFQSLNLDSNGVALPGDIASVFQDKLNDMIDFKKLGKNNFVISAKQVAMNGQTLNITGSAALTRLEFGK